MSMHYVDLETLGKCEHCQGLISIMEYAGGDVIGATWGCSHCKAEVTGASFGYNSTHVKVRWVGPGAVWQNKRPNEDFVLGDAITVCVRPPIPR